MQIKRLMPGSAVKDPLYHVLVFEAHNAQNGFFVSNDDVEIERRIQGNPDDIHFVLVKQWFGQFKLIHIRDIGDVVTARSIHGWNKVAGYPKLSRDLLEDLCRDNEHFIFPALGWEEYKQSVLDKRRRG